MWLLLIPLFLTRELHSNMYIPSEKSAVWLLQAWFETWLGNQGVQVSFFCRTQTTCACSGFAMASMRLQRSMHTCMLAR